MEVSKNEVVTTGLRCEKRQFTWKIKDFDKIRQKDEFICDQKFKFQLGGTIGLLTDWTCYLKPEVTTEDSGKKQKWIGIFSRLDAVPKKAEKILATFQITVKDDTKVYFRADVFRNFLGEDGSPIRGWGWTEFIPQDAYLEALPLDHGCLNVEVELTLFAPVTAPKLSQALYDIAKKYKSRFNQKLVQDLASILTNVSSSQSLDIPMKIVSRDHKEFRVSENILAARSPVFRVQFQKLRNELFFSPYLTATIGVKDLSSETVNVLLRFIYTGTLHDDWVKTDVLVELVYAANKYGLQDLHEFLDQVVGQVCCKENVGKLLNLAKKQSMAQAEMDLVAFMKQNVTGADDLAAFLKDSTAQDVIETGTSPSYLDGFLKRFKKGE